MAIRRFKRLASDSDAPSASESVRLDLEAIDKGLYLVWRKRYMDLTTGEALATRAGYIHRPRWYVFLDHPLEGQVFLFRVEDENNEPLPLDGRVAHRIRSDIGRHLDAEEVNRRIAEASEQGLAARRAAWEQRQGDVVAANPRKIAEVFEGDNLNRGPSRNVRDPKTFSYDGAAHRASAAEQEGIPLTPKEEGWELPEHAT